MELNKVFELAPMLIDARERTGNKKLSHRVEQGKFQLVQITYKKGGSSDVVEVGPWLPFEEYKTFLAKYR